MTSLRWIVLLAVLAGPPALADPEHTATNPHRLSVGEYERNLPLIFLEAKEPALSEQKVACSLRILCPEGSEGRDSGPLPGGIQLHGGMSRSLPKKSFSIRLQHPAQLLDLREHAHWILNAACIDRSLMRHKLSFDLFRSLSAQGVNRCAAASRFVEVYFNGKYEGVYLLMERVDKQLLGLRADKGTNGTPAVIYKAIDHAANFGQLGHSGYKQREPNPALKAVWQPLDAFNRFVVSSTAEEFFNPQSGIASRVDLDNAIDFHLLVLLTSNGDGITKNFFLARTGQRPAAPRPQFFFAPWDYDGTFGRNWNATVVPPSSWLSNHLFDRLLADKTYRDKFVARWKQVRSEQFSLKIMQGMIDTNARTLGQAARRNALRWPAAGGPYPDTLTFEQDVSAMKAWTEARLRWLDEEMKKLQS